MLILYSATLLDLFISSNSFLVAHTSYFIQECKGLFIVLKDFYCMDAGSNSTDVTVRN